MKYTIAEHYNSHPVIFDEFMGLGSIIYARGQFIIPEKMCYRFYFDVEKDFNKALDFCVAHANSKIDRLTDRLRR